MKIKTEAAAEVTVEVNANMYANYPKYMQLLYAQLVDEYGNVCSLSACTQAICCSTHVQSVISNIEIWTSRQQQEKKTSE